MRPVLAIPAKRDSFTPFHRYNSVATECKQRYKIPILVDFERKYDGKYDDAHRYGMKKDGTVPATAGQRSKLNAGQPSISVGQMGWTRVITFCTRV